MFWPWRDRSDSQAIMIQPTLGEVLGEKHSAMPFSRKLERGAIAPGASPSANDVIEATLIGVNGQRPKSPVTQMPNGSTRELYQFREFEILLIRQPYRRRISMVHQLTGRVKVTCPKGMREVQINEFLEKHVDWMKSNVAQFETIRVKHPEKKYVQDELFVFRGEDRRLLLMPGGSRGEAEILGDRLIVYVPTLRRPAVHLNSASDIRGALVQKIVLAFYEKQGRKILAERARYFANKLRLHPTSLSFRSQKTRWGSCTTRGKISLNWRLIFAPPATLDYVVIHELCHLRHHNHSAAFWNLVQSECADYLAHKRWLKEHVYDADFLAKSSEIHPGA